MSTVDQIRNRIYRILADPSMQSYAEELFFDSLGAALDAILPWLPKTATETIVGDGSNIYALPDDCYEVETVVVNDTGEMLTKAMLIPNRFRGDDIQNTNDWLEYPNGSITFSKELSVGETYTLYYLAHWTKPTIDSDDSELLETPDYVDTALTFYILSQMLIPSVISAAVVRQFNTRIDSGNPEDNPMEKTATYLLKLFTEEMNRHPKYQKAQK